MCTTEKRPHPPYTIFKLIIRPLVPGKSLAITTSLSTNVLGGETHQHLSQNRLLTKDVDVWSKNAWDHVPPPDDQDDRIASSLARQRSKPVPLEDKPKYNEKPARHW
jgi:hypothetical protein